jgi:hypothetical protein
VKDWNAKRIASSYAGKSWDLMHDRSAYRFGERDDMPYETNLTGHGRVFRHPSGKADSKYFTTLLTVSPAGYELTLSFAEALNTLAPMTFAVPAPNSAERMAAIWSRSNSCWGTRHYRPRSGT